MPLRKYILAALLMSGGPACGQTVRSDDERLFLAELSALRCGSISDKEIWPGYKIGHFAPLSVYLPKSRITVLFTETGPLPGFKPAYGDVSRHACGKKDPGVYSRVGKAARAERNFAFERAAGREVFVFNLERSEGRSVSQLRLLAHEYFHLLQRSWRPLSERAEPHYADIPARSYAWMLIEDLLLAKAVMAEDDEVRSIAREFVRVRKYRLANEPESLIAWENQEEATEGTALYADMQAERVVKKLPMDWPASRSPEVVQMALQGFEKIDPGFIKQRYYSSGAAQGIIMDRLGIPWKSRVSQGEPVFRVLSDSLPFAWVPAPGFYLKLKYGLSRLEAFAQEWISSWLRPEEIALRDFLKKKGERLRVITPFLHEAAIHGPMPIKSGSKKSGRYDEYYRGAEIFEAIRRDEFEILVKNSDLMFGYTGEVVESGKFTWDVRFSEFVFPPEDPLRFVIDGAAVARAAVGERTFKTLVIESGRARIRVHGGGRLSNDGAKIVLTIFTTAAGLK